MTRSALVIVLVLTCAGCSLALDRSRHRGGGATDAATDVDGAVDGGREDGGFDADRPDADLPDADTSDGGLLSNMLMTSTGPADFSCRVSRQVPDFWVGVTMRIVDHASRAPMPGQRVEVWDSAEIGETCGGAPCSAFMADGSGDAAATLSNRGWFGYRVPGSSATVDVLAYDRRWDGVSLSVDIETFSAATVGGISLALDRGFESGSGVASGTVRDCAGLPVAGARVLFYRDGVEVVSGSTSDTPRISGLEGTDVTLGGETGTEGAFAGANLAPSGSYRVEVHGRVRGPGDSWSDDMLVGCEEGRVVAAGLTLFAIGPLRDDYVMGSGCAR